MRIAVGELTEDDARKPVKTGKAKHSAKKRAKAG